jgi:hypothetical protein
MAEYVCCERTEVWASFPPSGINDVFNRPTTEWPSRVLLSAAPTLGINDRVGRILNAVDLRVTVDAEHNEVAKYVSEIRGRGSFRLGASSTGTQSHLASFQNTSQWNYRRDRNVANYQPPNVHSCSLQVVRNASADPLKYVMKYFSIKADEVSLADVEKLGEDITRLEDAVNNLGQREASIAESVDPPAFILKHYADEFMKHVGVELSPISVSRSATQPPSQLPAVKRRQPKHRRR